MDNPTSDEIGAGGGANFRGGRDAKASLRQGAGVVEARPGIIENSHIAPLGKLNCQHNEISVVDFRRALDLS